MKLYYVRADDENGENADAYVWAKDYKMASFEVQAYWKKWSGWAPMVQWVDEVPTKPELGVVDWPDVVRHEAKGATKF
jgi:hypothetical protein